jgi:peptidyl-prolyl cis-trans isomerase SurA
MRTKFLFSALLIGTVLFFAPAAIAQESAVIATVNDRPVTTVDIDQRIKLLQLLGQKGGFDRKKLANDVINDWVKINEAQTYKIDPTDKEIDERLGGMAKNLKTDMTGLEGKLAAQGISLSSMRRYVAAQMSFNRLLSAKYKAKIEVDAKAVESKYKQVTDEIKGKVAKVEADPRRQPVKVISLLQIDFPVEGNDPQLMQSRAIEAVQFVQKFRSCGSARAAASGIFNVKIGKVIEADARKLPAPLKSAMEAKGVGHAIGPMRGPKGIQAIAYCGTRTITPPPIKYQLPSREQIQNMAMNEQYDRLEAKYVALMRKSSVIEYKNQSYVQ